MPLGRLPITMVAFYNGHTFNETTETVDLQITPQYDAAGRTVIYSIYSITLREILSPRTAGLIAAGGPSEAASAAFVATTVAQLSRPAGILRYQGRGFGDLVINIGPKSDVVWGPKPKVIGLKPHGGPTVELTWRVEVAIPNCDDAIFKFALMEFNFRLSFNKDRQGYTTREYTGFLRIPQTRTNVASRTLTDSADNYLNKIYPPLLPGFRRIPGTWTLSEDKCRGDFSITDEQMPPNAPPLDCIEAQSNHTYHTGRSLADWVATLSATYDIARGSNTTNAITSFMALFNQRTKLDTRMKIGDGLDFLKIPKALAPTIGQPVSIIPIAAMASEPNVYGRTQVSLSITYTFAGVGFGAVFSQSGLWQPLGTGAGGKWADWISSVGGILGARGHAGLVFRTTDDGIIDLCGASPAVPPSAPPSRNVIAPRPAPSLVAQLMSNFTPPTPGGSWLHYHCNAVVHADPGRVPVVTLPSAPLPGPGQQTAPWDSFGAFPVADGTAATAFAPLAPLLNPNSQGGSSGAVAVQQRTKPQLFVTIEGQALRAGYTVGVPQVVSINGAAPTLVGRPYFSQAVVANAFVPIVRADWRMTYLFTDDGGLPKGAVPVPPNPFLA